MSQNNSEEDLEKTLIVAAADADARNNLEEASNTDKSEENSLYIPQKRQKLSETSKSTKTDCYANVVASHYNQLEEKGVKARFESRIVYMRNFHNWIKSMLINEYLEKVRDKKKHNDPISVLDLCCGKGGDLYKWRKGGIKHLICADIADISLEQCKQRYTDMNTRKSYDRTPMFSIEYIVADCSKVVLLQKFKDPSLKLDIVSCQFAFHYSFESLSQSEVMVKNASECLKPGGYFFGTIPDDNEIISRLRQSNTQSFGNDIYEVTCDFNKEQPDLFGSKYHFQLEGVVNCPEFLVHFPLLVKLCRKYGLKLVAKDKFLDYYNKHKTSDNNLLTIMKGLETYPPNQGVKLVGTMVGTHADYDHVKEYFDKSKIPVGTLSKSEWEVSSIYITFAFQKVNYELNIDGTYKYKF